MAGMQDILPAMPHRSSGYIRAFATV